MGKFIGIQFLRGFAASLVMFLHVLQKLDIKPIGDFFITGQYSVDIFFILSGFLIFLTVNNNTDKNQYLKKRIFRIYPMYLFTLILFIFFNIHILGLNYDVTTLIKNVLMFPWDSNWSYKSLIVVVAWSTMFEMMFYFLFYIILLLNLDKKKIFILIPILFLLSKLLFKFHIINTDTPIISLLASILSSSFVFLFFIGCCLSYVYINYNIAKFNNKTFKFLLIISIIMYISGHFFIYNIFYSMICSTFLFWMVLLVDKYYVLDVNSKSVKFFNSLGDISFSIYLLHMLIINILINIFNVSNLILMLLLTTTITYILSFVTYELIEKKFISLAKK